MAETKVKVEEGNNNANTISNLIPLLRRLIELLQVNNQNNVGFYLDLEGLKKQLEK